MSEELHAVIILHPTPGKEARVCFPVSYISSCILHLKSSTEVDPDSKMLTRIQLKEVLLDLANTIKDNEEGCVSPLILSSLYPITSSSSYRNLFLSYHSLLIYLHDTSESNQLPTPI